MYKIYKILNWNTALTEKVTNISDILQFVKNFLDGENTIAVLQQIPCKVKAANAKWTYSESYNKFLNTFPEKEYMIISNETYNNGYVFMQTVIVTKVKVSPCDNSIYIDGTPTNREVGIVIENKFSLLGLHAKNGKDNLPYIKSINGMADVIVGDFNAGDYQEYKYWEQFRSILSSHVCICNLPTKRIENSMGEIIRETCIDHIFVKRELVTQCDNVKVHKNITFSDHYPITFTIKIRE